MTVYIIFTYNINLNLNIEKYIKYMFIKGMTLLLTY